MTALSLALALAAPYLYVYDLALLAPAWIWLVDRAVSPATVFPRPVKWAVVVGYLAPLFGPVTAVVRLQPSVPLFAFLLWSLWRSCRERGSS